jgi:two-component system KDP operon response regulator KdpE
MADKILVVDDNPHVVQGLQDYLEKQDYQVVTAGCGYEAMRLVYGERPDLVLLDIMMPGLDGWQVCRRIREVSDVPIIMLTAVGDDEGVIQGLEIGADDYVIKPFRVEVLLARIRAALRRVNSDMATSPDRTYNDGYLSVHLGDRHVAINGQPVRLTPTEYKLLAMLVENKGRVLPFNRILETVWGAEYVSEIDYVRTYIWHLRRKVEPDPRNPRYLLSELDVGYRFQPQE